MYLLSLPGSVGDISPFESFDSLPKKAESNEAEAERAEEEGRKAMASSGPSTTPERIRFKQKLQESKEFADLDEDFSPLKDEVPLGFAQPDLQAEIEAIDRCLAAESNLHLSESVSQEADGKEETLKPELLTDEELGEWMRFFGLKTSSSRDFMLRRLNDIVDYLDGGTAFLHSIRETPTPHRPKRPRKEKMMEGDNEATEDTPTRTPKRAKTKARAARVETPSSQLASRPVVSASEFSPAQQLGNDEKKSDVVDGNSM